MTNPARSTIDLEANKGGSALDGLSLGTQAAETIRQEAASLPPVERPAEAPAPEVTRRAEPSVPNVDTYQTSANVRELRNAVGTNPDSEVRIAGATSKSEHEAEHELERNSLFSTRTVSKTIFDRLVQFVARLIKRLELRILKALKKQPRRITIIDKAVEKRKAHIRAALRQSRYHPLDRVQFDSNDGDRDSEDPPSGAS